jgi:hypothetical protein
MRFGTSFCRPHKLLRHIRATTPYHAAAVLLPMAPCRDSSLFGCFLDKTKVRVLWRFSRGHANRAIYAGWGLSWSVLGVLRANSWVSYAGST